MEEVFDMTEVLLEVTLLGEGDLPLTLSKLSTFLLKSMSIAELAGKQSIWRVVDEKAEVEICIFLESLLDATIRDGGIRERRGGVTFRSPSRLNDAHFLKNRIKMVLVVKCGKCGLHPIHPIRLWAKLWAHGENSWYRFPYHAIYSYCVECPTKDKQKAVEHAHC